MKLDTHVHTHHSGYTTIKPLDRIMRESYNSVEGVYRLAKSRGVGGQGCGADPVAPAAVTIQLCCR